MKKKFLRCLFVVFFLLPFILGTIGYCIEGLDLIDAAYGSFALYLVNPVADEKNLTVELARWLAPLATTSGILLAIREIGYKITNFFRSLSKKTIAIYSDNSFGEMMRKNIGNSILITDDTVYKNKNVIIMYSNDKDSLEFYRENEKKLEDKNVYMKLDSFNPLCIAEGDVKYFNMGDIVARDYWKSHDLSEYFDAPKMSMKSIKIAIIGFNDLGERILNNGLLNNIYSLDQCIEYHIWGSSTLYENLHKDFCPMNNDKVIYHRSDIEEEISTLTQMDRVIIADSTDYHLLTAIFEICTKNEIDCFSPDGSLIGSIYDNKRIKIFGDYKNLLTYENIITDKLYELAMELNYKYACLYGEATGNSNAEMKKEWDKQDGFTKMSNVASADYHDIRLIIMQSRKSNEIDDYMCELEHIRWCRFHYLNHWRYGKPEKGQKDKINHIHSCLVPYNDLSTTDKDKDAEMIGLLIKLKNK